jgi:hypothetical protein
LRQVEAFRCPGQIQKFGNCSKGTKLGQFHSWTTDRPEPS